MPAQIQTQTALTCCPSPDHTNDSICGGNTHIGQCHPPKPSHTPGPGNPQPTHGLLSEMAYQLERQLNAAIAQNADSVPALRLALANQLLLDGLPEVSAFVAQQIEPQKVSAPLFQQSLVIRQHCLTHLENFAGANEIRKELKKFVNSPIK